MISKEKNGTPLFLDSSLQIYVHVMSEEITKRNEQKAKELMRQLKLLNKGQQVHILPHIQTLDLDNIDPDDVIVGSDVWFASGSSIDPELLSQLMTVQNKGNFKRVGSDEIRTPSEKTVLRKKNRKTFLRLDDEQFFDQCLKVRYYQIIPCLLFTYVATKRFVSTVCCSVSKV